MGWASAPRAGLSWKTVLEKKKGWRGSAAGRGQMRPGGYPGGGTPGTSQGKLEAAGRACPDGGPTSGEGRVVAGSRAGAMGKNPLPRCILYGSGLLACSGHNNDGQGKLPVGGGGV